MLNSSLYMLLQLVCIVLSWLRKHDGLVVFSSLVAVAICSGVVVSVSVLNVHIPIEIWYLAVSSLVVLMWSVKTWLWLR